MDMGYNQELKTINENKSSDQLVEEKKRRRKCHGNRKVQRFRKKCRARGMKPHNIEKKIKKRFGDSRTNQPTSITMIQLTIVLKQSYQFSISQPGPKKLKKQNIMQTSVLNPDKVYRVAFYLKRSPRLLIQILDLQFCLNIHQSLWQSYFDLGYEQHQWPDQKFVQEYLAHIQQRLEQYTLIASDFYTPALEDQYSLNYKLKRSKILQETKRTWLDILMESYDVKMKACNRQYQEELTQLELDISNHQHHHHDASVLFRTVQAYIKHRTIQIKKDTFQQVDSFHGKLSRRHHRFTRAQETMDVSPEVILNVNDHSLTVIGHEYLSQNRNYIRPNRTALRSYKERVKIVQEQHGIMVNQTKLRLPEKNGIDAGSKIFKQFSQRLLACLMLHYMTSLPFIEHARTQRDLQTVKLIRRKLKNSQLLLRETARGGNLYVNHMNEFEEKAVEYRMKTGAHEELSSSLIEEILSKVTHLLNDLYVKARQLSFQQYKKMIPSRLTVELVYMYYNPKTHKNPIHVATTGISRYLDQSIRPLFDMHSQPRSIIDGGHLLRQLEQYVKTTQTVWVHAYLQPTTLFCTADITNLYTMLPQDESLEILEEFLREHHYEKVQDIPIRVILQLAHLVLKETAFVDGNKFYRQIIGGAMGSPFTLILANIFMWKWEKNVICSALEPNEIYGRYIDLQSHSCSIWRD
ncbi:unnamed protein product [Rotaria magnacalcarata]|uniref:Reverse transcriptase domain-containing protein n=1 Tax=Rotaria magnacalcarata TaxID=392030 RepID=A0A815KUI1_9BILA|nr:unnamed protein product [Rotaria magnacalcarata]